MRETYLRTSDGWGEGGWQPHMHRHITSEPATVHAVVLRCGVVRLGGAVVVVQLWWCMVHDAFVIVACKN
jgi:hypothetical protein